MFERCLYFNTTSLARRLDRAWSQAFKPFGLTPPQAFMLRVILDKSLIAYTELARELNISKATCSRTVEGLIKRDLVERLQEKEDARSFQLRPTDKAKILKKPLNDAAASVTNKIKGIIGDREFTDTVQQVRDVDMALK